MAFWKFTGAAPELFSAIGLNAKPGRVYDFGSITPPGEGIPKEGTSPTVTSKWAADTGPATDFLLAGAQASDVARATLPWFDVRDYGAVGDGVTDDYVAIQAAITAVQAAGGGRLNFGAKVYAVGTDLVVTASDVLLVGAGTLSGIYQGAPTTGTSLKRVGATAGDVLRFQTPAGSATAISGCAVENMAIVGNNTAAKGLSLKSVQWSTFKNLHIRNCTDTAVDMFIESSVLDLVEDTQGNVFERITISQTTSATGIGIRLDGTSPLGNSSLNSFSRVSVQHTNGVGIKLLNADSNVFSGLTIVRAGGGTGIGVELNGSASLNAGHARSNRFYMLDPGVGGVTARGSALVQPSVNNMIFGHSRENGAPFPTIESGATLYLVGEPASNGPSTSYIRDDFAAGSIGSTAVGELGWTVTNGTFTTVTAVAGHPGIFNHSVTTSASVASLRLGGSNDTGILPADFFDTTFIIRLNNNTTNTDIRVGLGNASGTAPPGAGLYIEKAFADTQWFGVARASSVQSRTSALATVTTNFVKFRIRRVNSTTIAYSVDGGAEATLNTNVPTAGLAFFTQISNNDGVAKSFDIDYFDCTYTGLGR